MNLTEELIKACVERVHGCLTLNYDGREIDFSVPFKRISMKESIKEVCGVDLKECGSLEAAKDAVLEALRSRPGVSVGDERKIMTAASIGHLMNVVFETVVEDELWQPTFVVDYPVEVSPLAKLLRSQKGLTERFELFIAGRELANSFSELTDPLDQRDRLQKQYEEKMQEHGKESSKPLPYQVQSDIQRNGWRELSM